MPYTHTTTAASILCGLTLLLTPHTTHANPLDVFGFGARSTALGEATTSSANDFSAVYYNLAAMTETNTAMGIGLLFSGDYARIRLKRRPLGYNLPDRGQTSPSIPSSYRLRNRSNTNDILNTHGFFFGGIGSFNIDRLRIGVLAYLPTNRLGLLSTHYADEREQYFSNQLHFEFLGTTTQHQVVVVGAAWRVLDALSVGLGLAYLPGTGGTNFVYLDNPTDQSNADFTLFNEQQGQVAPHAGILWKPLTSLKIGASYHGEIFFPFEVSNEIQIRGFQGQDGAFPIEQKLQAVSAYSPHKISLGSSWVTSKRSLSLDAQYALWSLYLNNQAEPPDEPFNNTLSLRFGWEEHILDWLSLRSGLGWIPSPIPDQTGRTNYVDNDRITLSTGIGHPFRLLDFDIEVSWAFKLQLLLPRDTNKTPLDSYPDCTDGETRLCDEISDNTKDPSTGQDVPEYQGLQTGNPGFPGFLSYGVLSSIMVDAQWKF